jgi:hypothetical protein
MDQQEGVRTISVCCAPVGTANQGIFGTVVTSWKFADKYPITADCLPSLESLRHPESFKPRVMRPRTRSSLFPPDEELVKQYGDKMANSLAGFRSPEGRPVTVPPITHQFDTVNQEYAAEVHRRLHELDKCDWGKS